MANPTLLTSPIAENGDKNVIPASTGATTGLLDQEHGFQQINELPLQAGGLPPQRKDFNGIFNLLSGILYMAQRGYTFEYDNTLPYVAGCIVRDTDGKLYRCINDVSAGGTQPSLDTTNWELYEADVVVAKNLTTPGYVKCSSGLHIEWGGATFPATYPTHGRSFALTFTAPPIMAFASNANQTLYLSSISTTDFELARNPILSSNSTYYWFAMGY